MFLWYSIFGKGSVTQALAMQASLNTNYLNYKYRRSDVNMEQQVLPDIKNRCAHFDGIRHTHPPNTGDLVFTKPSQRNVLEWLVLEKSCIFYRNNFDAMSYHVI